jgi:8-oxo-dGTP pyrophosphatase MutT (NUDIX family)
MVLEFSEEASPALSAASAIVIRQTHEGLETLLLKRSDELKHMPGLWVFPGGKVEVSDEGDNDLEQARSGAARELQEEAGLSLPAETLLTFSHWLTPVVVKRRFATWFFIAEVGSDELVTVDDSEIVAHEWWRPRDAIRAHHEGQLSITPPTLVSLHDLQVEDDPSVLLSQLGERSPPRFFPRVVRDGDQMTFLYEGDAAYENGDLCQQGAQHRTLGARGIFRYVGAD